MSKLEERVKIMEGEVEGNESGGLGREKKKNRRRFIELARDHKVKWCVIFSVGFVERIMDRRLPLRIISRSSIVKLGKEIRRKGKVNN